MEVDSFDSLLSAYEKYEKQHGAEVERRFKEGFGQDTQYEYMHILNWMRVSSIGICPQAFIDREFEYWWGMINSLDGEMGLQLPQPSINDIPNYFWEILAIIRNERGLARDENGKKNSNNDNRQQ